MGREDEDYKTEDDAEGSADGHEGKEPVKRLLGKRFLNFGGGLGHTMVYRGVIVIEQP